MKLTESTMAKPQTSGNMPVQNIGISDDPLDQQMVLNILTNTLYSDKIAACCREYGCNAFDANVEAGRGDQPIEVRLPNRLDPTFSVRDFGYGMDEEQIRNVFCKLGRSTKRKSNAFTGMLGIGSKAGFAYGDQFMITSYVEGTKTVYNAFRDQGIPMLAKMHSESSSSPDGIEVKIPVRAADIPGFCTTAERVYRYFRVRPIIHGGTIQWVGRQKEYEGTGWRYLGNNQTSVAIMGNIGYSLDSAALGLQNEPTYTWRLPLRDSRAAVVSMGVELDFEIGDLEIASNREGLQYDDRTKKAILNRLVVVENELGKILSKAVSSATSLWEAKKLYHNTFEGINSSSIGSVVKNKVLWNGKKINSGQFELDNTALIAGVSVVRYERRMRRGTIKLCSWGYASSIYPNDQVMLIINDLPGGTHSPARLKGAFEANPNVTSLIVFKFDSALARDKYWKDKGLEGAPTTYLSTIAPISKTPGVPGAPRAHNRKHSSRVFILDESCTQATELPNSGWWTSESADLKNDTGVYVELDHFTVSLAAPAAGTPAWQSSKSFLESVKMFRKAGLITETSIYGFKRDAVGKLGKGWKALEDAIAENLDELIKKKNLAQVIADYNVVHDSDFRAVLPVKFAKDFPAKSAMGKYLMAVEEALNPKLEPTVKAIHQSKHDVYGEYWITMPALPAPSLDFKAEAKAILSTYPLLSHMAEYDRQYIKNVTAFVEYVKLIGK